MEQCSAVNDLFYDFIYLDKIRINTLLSQLSGDGVVSELKRSHSDTECDTSAVGVSSIFSLKKNASSTLQEKLEKSFDTSWVLPSILLNEISGIIKRNPKKPNNGDLILISGNLLLMDTPTLKKNLTLMEHIVREKEKEKEKGKEKGKEKYEAFKQGLKLINKLPDTIQLRLKDNNSNRYWTTLESQNFTVDVEHLSLKYGSILNGDWHVLCYIDSVPINEPSQLESPSNYFEENKKNKRHQSFINLFDSSMNALRDMAGCNNEEYAISPIMIFKPVR